VLVKLDKIDLVLGSTDNGERSEKDLRTILSISIKDKRTLVEQQIPGSSGNRLQDNGTEPVQISLEGELNGEDSSKAVKEIYKLYEAGLPVSFYSSLAAIAEVAKVDIENLQIEKAQGSAFHYGYRIDLKEHREQA
jgi:hypothetical protein